MKKPAPIQKKGSSSKNLDPRLRDDVSFLGRLLGEILCEQEGQNFFDLVEKVRLLSIDVRKGEHKASPALDRLLAKAPALSKQKLAKAFTEFLRLANLAEQVHRIRRREEYRSAGEAPQSASPLEAIRRLRKEGYSKKDILKELSQLQIELVLTAHPTETQLPTAIRRYQKMAELLLSRGHLQKDVIGRSLVEADLKREVQALWLSGLVRDVSPTPVDEARQALVLVEEVLWKALPRFLRELDVVTQNELGDSLPAWHPPLRYSSWIGGDRDGNPSVTAKVTREVVRESCLRALKLYVEDFKALAQDLRFSESSPLNEMDRRCREAMTRIEHSLREWQSSVENTDSLFICPNSLCRQTLRLYCQEIRDALIEGGAEEQAKGLLQDIERRLAAFGLNLLPLDLRQSSDRHEAAVAEILQISQNNLDYQRLSEKEKQKLLIQHRKAEALSRNQWHQLSAETREILETFQLYRDFPAEFFGLYIISMAEEISDLLEVEVLMSWAGLREKPAICPLFETPDALQRAADLMRDLLNEKWYVQSLGGVLNIMLGYSDSAKRSGRLHSAWGIYQLQQELTQIGRKAGVETRFFHGRGGSVARGGGPIQTALLGLPRPHASSHLRVTEQGESIVGKLGLMGLAERTMELYISGFLEARLSPADRNPSAWTQCMTEIAEDSAKAFQAHIYENPRFMPHYLQVTPADELSLLKIGSRPAKRRKDPSLDSLRAIPWVFSWTQNRALLPAWLGMSEALARQIRAGRGPLLKEMNQRWRFFHANLDLIEMTLAKADDHVFAYYSEILIEPALKDITETYLKLYHQSKKLMIEIKGEKHLLSENPVLARSIRLRTPYVDVLNILQVHLLKEARTQGLTPELEAGLALTLSGISSGMRNTG